MFGFLCSFRAVPCPRANMRKPSNITADSDAESTYLLRGTYRTGVASSQQKMTIIVESIVPGPPLSPAASARPEGRDWFVRAGSTGGDGTREKPFRDPFQALEKAEGGDAIHVAGGDYFGKLRSGKMEHPDSQSGASRRLQCRFLKSRSDGRTRRASSSMRKRKPKERPMARSRFPKKTAMV